MTTEDYPLVSALCLIDQHNIEAVDRCVRCFKSQTYPYKELILINNARTQLKASELNIEAQSDIFIVDTPAYLPAGVAKNYGISAANGTILAQFDVDCWYAPGRLEGQIATMAANNAHACMLVKCLLLSYNSHALRFMENDKNVIPQSVVYVRPKNIDYPAVEQGEELGILHKMNNAKMKLITMDQPTMMCKIIGNPEPIEDLKIAVDVETNGILPSLLDLQENQEKLNKAPAKQ